MWVLCILIGTLQNTIPFFLLQVVEWDLHEDVLVTGFWNRCFESSLKTGHDGSWLAAAWNNESNWCPLVGLHFYDPRMKKLRNTKSWEQSAFYLCPLPTHTIRHPKEFKKNNQKLRKQSTETQSLYFLVAWLRVESWLHQNNASSETLEKRCQCRAKLHSSIWYTEANPTQYKNQHFSGSFGNLMAPKETTDQPTVLFMSFCIDKYKSGKRYPFHSKFRNTDWHLYLLFFTIPSLQTWLNRLHNSTAQTSEGTSSTKLL